MQQDPRNCPLLIVIMNLFSHCQMFLWGPTISGEKSCKQKQLCERRAKYCGKFLREPRSSQRTDLADRQWAREDGTVVTAVCSSKLS